MESHFLPTHALNSLNPYIVGIDCSRQNLTAIDGRYQVGNVASANLGNNINRPKSNVSMDDIKCPNGEK